jgi:hypothetical protein
MSAERGVYAAVRWRLGTGAEMSPESGVYAAVR